MGRKIRLCSTCKRRNRCKKLCKKAEEYLARKKQVRITNTELVFYCVHTLRRAGVSVRQIKKAVGIMSKSSLSTLYNRSKKDDSLFDELALYFLSKYRRFAIVSAQKVLAQMRKVI